MPRTKVMIVDDHEVVRMGISAVLQSEETLEVVGEVRDGATAVRDIEVLQPDVVLMDVMMPGMDGIEACRQIRDRFPDCKVVMLTSNSSEEAVVTSIIAGASGYILKNTGSTGIINAIKSAATGKSLLDPDVTSRVLEQLRRLTESQSDVELATLSDREKQILGLLAEGLTNSEIADRLVISPNTARNHVSRILAKLGMSRRSEAAVFAVEHGLSTTDSDAD